jgi:hypothetical protein
MNRPLLVAAGLLAAFTALPAAASPDTFAEAKALAVETGKPLLVDFYATW